jgi:hypothetical protein
MRLAFPRPPKPLAAASAAVGAGDPPRFHVTFVTFVPLAARNAAPSPGL